MKLPRPNYTKLDPFFAKKNGVLYISEQGFFLDSCRSLFLVQTLSLPSSSTLPPILAAPWGFASPLLLLTLRSRQLSPIGTWRHPPFIWELAGGFQQIVNFIKLDRDVSGGYLGPKPGGWTLHFVQGGPRLDLVLLDDDCHRTFGGAFSPPSALQRLV